MDTQFDIKVGEALYEAGAYSSNKISSMITQLDEDIKSRLPMTSTEDLAVTAKSLAITTTSGKGLSVAQQYTNFQYGNGLSSIYIDSQPLASYIWSVCNPSYAFGELNTDPKEQHAEDGQPVRTYEIQLQDRTINKLYIQGNTPTTTNYIDVILPEPKHGHSREFKLYVQADEYAPKTWLRLITEQSGSEVVVIIPFSYALVSGAEQDQINLVDVKKAAAARWPNYFAALAGNVFGLGEEPSAKNLADFINEMTDNAFSLNVESSNFLFDAFYAVQRDYARVKKGTTIYQFNELGNIGNGSTFTLDVQSGDKGAFAIYRNRKWPVGPNG